MRLPGFTAERSLYRSGRQYRGTGSPGRPALPVSAAKLPSPIAARDPLDPESSPTARDPLYPRVELDLIRLPGTGEASAYGNIFVRGDNFKQSVGIDIKVYNIKEVPIQAGAQTSAALARCQAAGRGTMCYYDPGGQFLQCMGTANCLENNPGNIKVVVRDNSDGSEYEYDFIRSCRAARPGDPTVCKLPEG